MKEAAPTSAMAIFSASGPDEISGPAPGEPVGLFTKYLVDALGSGAADVNGDGQVSLQELATWVSPRVSGAARKDQRVQTPLLRVGNGLDADSFAMAWGYPSR